MPVPVAQCVLLLALIFAPPAAYAQSVAPDALLRAVSDKVIDQIKQDQELATPDPARVAAVVEINIMPLFDFVHMTRLAMARNWRLATPEQQALLAAEFRVLLARTYSSALGQYSGESVDFKNLRASRPASEVTVRSEVKQPGKERMTLDYDLEQTAQGWKIYDVKVAGVRLVSTYQDIFAEKVREGGIDGLIKFLEDGNRNGGSRFNSISRSFWERLRLMYAAFNNEFRGGRQ